MYPEFVTHYYLADKSPFLNLSDLGENELIRTMAELESRRAKDSEFNRVFGGRYMDLRRKTEKKLRSLFIAAGGKPQRKAPHYFVLGESYWFKFLCPNTEEVRIPLDYFSADSISVTYPDSFVSMGYMPDFGLPVEKKPYHGVVYKPSDLAWLVNEYGLPRDDIRKEYKNYVNEKFEKFIEVQVWDDAPLNWLRDEA